MVAFTKVNIRVKISWNHFAVICSWSRSVAETKKGARTCQRLHGKGKQQ